MWLIDAFASGFATGTSDWRMEFFRLAIGLACLSKAVEGFRHGGWDRLATGSFEVWRLRRDSPVRAARIAAAYKPALIIRLLASAALLLGLAAPVAIAILILGLVYELQYEWRSHTVFIIGCLAILLTAGKTGTAWLFSASVSSANTWAQVLLVLFVTHLYWNSAWMKIRTRQFSSGNTLALLFYGMSQNKKYYRFREFHFPRAFDRLLAGNTPGQIAAWRFLGLAAIGAEILVPLLLVFDSTHLIGIVIGGGMHAIFTLIMPRRLLPFTLATVGAYVAFIPV